MIMGEEEKKPPAPAPEEATEKKDEAQPPTIAEENKPVEDGKKEEKKAAEDAPPAEIVLKVFMHCEGCARKVRRCLKGLQGVEEVITDYRTSKVVVRGEKADPSKVLEKVQKKSHRKVELISPSPPIPMPPPPAPNLPEKDPISIIPQPQEIITPQQPPLVTVVLGVYMHCEACAQHIKKRIQRMKGVESAEADLKTSHVTIKGSFEPQKLVDYVYKRTGKHAIVIKVEPDEKADDKPKEENKAAEGEEKEEAKKTEGEKEKKESSGGGGGETAGEVEDPKVELMKREMAYYEYPQNYHYDDMMYPQWQREGVVHESVVNYPPQMFSDENPNACRVM